jgi:hypothetical protein
MMPLISPHYAIIDAADIIFAILMCALLFDVDIFIAFIFIID